MPITFILHALCSDQMWMCDWLQYGHLEPQWQLCPRGQSQCGPGQFKWNGNVADTKKILELSLQKAHERHGARVRDDGTVLVGISQGAYASSLSPPLDSDRSNEDSRCGRAVDCGRAVVSSTWRVAITKTYLGEAVFPVN